MLSSKRIVASQTAANPLKAKNAVSRTLPLPWTAPSVASTRFVASAIHRHYRTIPLPYQLWSFSGPKKDHN